jgi:hypothetical protein
VREARATATIKSEHVVRVLDVALRDGGGPYIVMEYLEGCDVAAWLRTHGPPEVHVAVDFVLQACDAIAEAHELGIIHRDLKPANMFAVQREGVVETIKVLDFGISKAAGLVSSTAPPGEWRPGAIITEERTPIGSPCYMSPEQMESARDVDRRTDIWALGVTLYELLSGRLPFPGQSLVQVYSAIKSGCPLRLRDELPAIPRGLEAVVKKCLETDRCDRYGSVHAFAFALLPFASGEASLRVDRMRRGYAESASDRRDAGSSGPGTALVRDGAKADATLLSSGELRPARTSRMRASGLLLAAGLGVSLAGLAVVRYSPAPAAVSPVALAQPSALVAIVATAEASPALKPPRDPAEALESEVSAAGVAAGPALPEASVARRAPWTPKSAVLGLHPAPSTTASAERVVPLAPAPTPSATSPVPSAPKSAASSEWFPPDVQR